VGGDTLNLYDQSGWRRKSIQPQLWREEKPIVKKGGEKEPIQKGGEDTKKEKKKRFNSRGFARGERKIAESELLNRGVKGLLEVKILPCPKRGKGEKQRPTKTNKRNDDDMGAAWGVKKA